VLVSASVALPSPVLAAPSPSPSPAAGPLASTFRDAAAQSAVPEDLLLAVGWVNTHWRMETSEDKGVGIMHLVHGPGRDTLAEAASLSGSTEAALTQDAAANIRGGAAVLGAAAPNPRPADLAGWRPALTAIGGGSLYADQVLEALRQGAKATLPGGEQLVLPPHPSVVAAAPTTPPRSADYGPAAWVPASSANFTPSSRPSVYIPNRVVIHVAQGSYSGTISHFQNPSAQSSAHFVMRSSDGAATQMVREQDVAWHAGNWDYNTKSVGIEHEGFVDDPSWFTDAMYRASAQLVASLVRKYSIPLDRQHIVGHNEVPDPLNPTLTGGIDHHTDPGPYWNWGLYMSYVRSYAGTYCGPNGFGRWQHLPGAAYEVGVGPTGAVWVIGTDPAYGGYGIYQWTGSRWVRSDGAGVRIAVDASGVPWVINVYGSIYRLGAQGWQQVNGVASDIAAGSDGSIWVVATDDTFGGFGIYYLTGAGWYRVAGGATRIAAGAIGAASGAWVVNSWGAIYERTGSTWTVRPGTGLDVGFQAGRRAVVVGTTRVCGGYMLWSWNGSFWNWVPGAAIGVSTGPDGKAWVVTETQDIYAQL
jgi:hypothetical protein